VFYARGDTHVDPPAFAISVCTILIGVLSLVGVTARGVYAPFSVIRDGSDFRRTANVNRLGVKPRGTRPAPPVERTATPMHLDARINRWQRDVAGLVLNEALLRSVAHVADQVSRGPILETMLDYLDPVLDGDLPPNAYIWGPADAGKSAVVTALFTHLRPRPSELGAIVHTAMRTRPGRERSPSFV